MLVLARVVSRAEQTVRETNGLWSRWTLRYARRDEQGSAETNLGHSNCKEA